MAQLQTAQLFLHISVPEHCARPQVLGRQGSGVAPPLLLNPEAGVPLPCRVAGVQAPWIVGMTTYMLGTDHPQAMMVPDIHCDARTNFLCVPPWP